MAELGRQLGRLEEAVAPASAAAGLERRLEVRGPGACMAWMPGSRTVGCKLGLVGLWAYGRGSGFPRACLVGWQSHHQLAGVTGCRLGSSVVDLRSRTCVA